MFLLNLVVCFLLILTATACAPAKANKSFDGVANKPLENPRARPDKICYTAAENQAVCYGTLERAKLPNQMELYKYLDPYTSSSFPHNFNKAQYVPPDRLLDLRNIPAKQLISPHFERNELVPENSSRGYYGLFSTAALVKLEVLRVNIGRAIYITSGYRSPGHNQKVDGAADWSRHIYGDAVDFKVNGLSYKALAQHCVNAGAGFYQVYTDHIHCDWRGLSGDRAFYPDPAVLDSTVLPLAVKSVQAEGKIMLRAQLEADGTQPLVLEAAIPQEDDGELLYEWEVTDQNGKIWASNNRLFNLPYKDHTYNVKVRIGGSVTLSREINIP